MRHDIFIATPRTFDALIGKFRTQVPGAVLYFEHTASSRTLIDGWYNDAAKALKGIAKVAAVDCEDSREFCKEQTGGVDNLPAIMIYPPHPMPHGAYTGEMSQKALTSHMFRLLPRGHVKELSAAAMQGFLAGHVGVPKAVLFSDKDKPPVLFHALANSFHDRMNFGFVNKSQQAIFKTYHVAKVPTLMVLKGEKKIDSYKGEMNFQSLHNFLNIHSETFVKGGGFSADAVENEMAKPWLTTTIPELTTHSYRDICTDPPVRSHCVIYLREGPLEPSELKLLEEISSKYRSSRGPQFMWMWMDVAVEKEFKEMFEPKALPSLSVLNPHRRLRFISIEGTATAESIETLIEKIVGGSSIFRNVKGQKLPKFADRDLEGKPVVKKGKTAKDGKEEL